MNPEDRKVMEMARDALEVCYARSVPRDVLRRKALAAIEERLQADEKEEPVAWMRAEGPDGISTQAYCITDRVKQIWLNANPKQVERYTIPLYAHGRKGNG